MEKPGKDDLFDLRKVAEIMSEILTRKHGQQITVQLQTAVAPEHRRRAGEGR